MSYQHSFTFFSGCASTCLWVGSKGPVCVCGDGAQEFGRGTLSADVLGTDISRHGSATSCYVTSS